MSDSKWEEVLRVVQGHTPAPWCWDSYSQINHTNRIAESAADERDDDIRNVAVICQPLQHHGDELHDPESRANAALIEIAPELLTRYLSLESSLAEVKAESARLRELLRSIEHVNLGEDTRCPVCYMSDEGGHRDDCALAIALAPVRGEETK